MMLSISNIAWPAENDNEMYAFLHDSGLKGLEIAPTRIFPEKPYEKLGLAHEFANKLLEEYGLWISSMQSIWYGKTENIFCSKVERTTLIEYTKQAVNFAEAVNCGNLVFGCPKNRNIPDNTTDPDKIAADFFMQIAEYANKKGVIVALEPNPAIYGTNFINTTEQAFNFVKNLGISGLKVNVDLGTMIVHDEPVSLIAENIGLVNHIHISEPGLAPIKKRELHKEILALPFDKYFSIEMGNCNDLEEVKRIATEIAKL